MPILEVDAVQIEGKPLPSDAAQRVADAAAEVLGTPPGRTWVIVRRIEREDYAENGVELSSDLGPVFVKLLEACPPEGAALEERTPRLTDALAAALERPAHSVHLLHEPPATGRMAFGGQPVR